MPPTTTKALVLRKAATESKPAYADAAIETRPLRPLDPSEILLKISAVALNHRDVWLRRGMYPGRQFGAVFGADGAGTVVASGQANDPLLNTKMFMTPMRGWVDHPDAPDGIMSVIGGVVWPQIGTFAEYVIVERDEVVPSPAHLSDIEMAAWPLAGLTAWRATIINGQVKAGQSVLITGIGGGVALVALQLCIAQGAHVYVTSGDQAKIDKAIASGAKGGVSYKNKDWPTEIGQLVYPAQLDVVIDAGGADIMTSVSPVLKQGGIVVCYGMTAAPKITFTMREVMRNQRLIGSTMGSRKDLVEATAFLAKHKIVPVVSHTFRGLEAAEDAFEVMRKGEQFGKVVIEIADMAKTAKL